jgi:WD40 repeat protein
VTQTLDHSEEVWTLAWSPDQTHLAVANAWNRRIYLWDIVQNREIWRIDVNGSIARASLGFNRDGTMIIIPSVTASTTKNSEHILSLFSEKNGNFIRDVSDEKPEKGTNLAVNFVLSDDRKQLAAILGNRGLFAIYDTESWVLLNRVGPVTNSYGFATGLTRVAIDRDRSIVILGFIDGEIQTWRISDNKLIKSFRSYETGLSALVFEPNSGAIVTGGEGGERGRPVVSPSGKTELTWYRDDPQSLVRSWDFSTGRMTRAYAGPTGGGKVTSLEVSPDGSRLAATQLNGHVLAWDMKTGELAAAIDYGRSHVSGATFSPDGRKLAYAVDSRVYIVDLELRWHSTLFALFARRVVTAWARGL